MSYDELLPCSIVDVPITVIDVETTGLSAQTERIIEFGAVKLLHGEVTGEYHTLLNPGRQIPYVITQITGITDREVADAPFFEDVAQQILEFAAGSVLCGHNLGFDISFLRKELDLTGHDLFRPLQLCTLKISRRLFPQLKSRSLGNVARHLKLRNPKAHRALSDARVTARVLTRITVMLEEQFGITTLEEMLAFQHGPKLHTAVAPTGSKLKNQFAQAPGQPGVYYFLNREQEVIYVGKAKSLKDRLHSYITPAAPRKSKKIVKQARTLKTQITNSELTALLSEAELIKKVNPKHNVQLKSYGHKYFLKFSTSATFPRPELTNRYAADGCDYFGLFVTRRKAAELLEVIDRVFMLRECDERELKKGKGCFLESIERCTAPCLNGDASAYAAELEKVYEFMHGRSSFALDRLLKQMKHYSEKLKFEKAAEIKAVIDLILAQVQKTALLAEPINRANVLLAVTGFGGAMDYLLMLSGRIHIQGYLLSPESGFENAIDDYYEGILQLQQQPDEEDLEKTKIILNWIIKNRNQVQIFYLKDYRSKQELLANVQLQLPRGKHKRTVKKNERL